MKNDTTHKKCSKCAFLSSFALDIDVTCNCEQVPIGQESPDTCHLSDPCYEVHKWWNR